ncbi:MAG: DUF3185 domain-containing protein [Alphaproteobacteria bacterium]|jgi:hypothetical protein|nr:DUF3185 domain-containing protein [Alphaproteobacteria bacterium]
MKPMSILGIVLIVAGIAGLFVSRISWTETKPVVKAGPIEINHEEDHSLWIPTAAGVVSVIAGLGLVMVSRKNA